MGGFGRFGRLALARGAWRSDWLGFWDWVLRACFGLGLGRVGEAWGEDFLFGCCLTIGSEERETWAAGSLRGLVVSGWLCPV